MPKTRLFGRPTGDRIQGTLTKAASRIFESARTLIHQHAAPSPVSDAEVVDFLALTWQEAGRSTHLVQRLAKKSRPSDCS